MISIFVRLLSVLQILELILHFEIEVFFYNFFIIVIDSFYKLYLPVETPQPSKHILLRSAPGLIFAAEISEMTAYSANVEQPMKW